MQQPPTGYGQSPQWYGQPQQLLPPNEQWAQQPYIPYPPQQVYQSQQGFAPQQPYPPHQGQFQQPSWQTPPPPQMPKKKMNVVKNFCFRLFNTYSYRFSLICCRCNNRKHRRRTFNNTLRTRL